MEGKWKNMQAGTLFDRGDRLYWFWAALRASVEQSLPIVFNQLLKKTFNSEREPAR